MKKIITILLFSIVILLGSCKKDIKVSSIVTNSDTIYLNIDSVLKVDVSIIPVDATSKDLTYEISDTSIASIDDNGLIKGLAHGETTLLIKATATPSIATTILVFVTDKNWPSDELSHFSNIELPIFPDFTYVRVFSSENLLKLVIYGTSDDKKALDDYKDSLLEKGFTLDGTFDYHSINFTHPTNSLYITIHNLFIHNNETIELVISKTNGNKLTWDDVNEEVDEHFSFSLPEFSSYEDLVLIHSENEVTIIIKGIKNVDESMDLYIDTLINNGFLLSSDSTHHFGSLSNTNLGILITYHESHDNLNEVELTISLLD